MKWYVVTWRNLSFTLPIVNVALEHRKDYICIDRALRPSETVPEPEINCFKEAEKYRFNYGFVVVHILILYETQTNHSVSNIFILLSDIYNFEFLPHTKSKQKKT